LKTLYTLLFYIALPFILLRLIWRGFRAPLYFQRWRERFGQVSPCINNKPVIWLHAVSVGEVEASKPLVNRLKEEYPNHQLVITTMTPTGSERVKANFNDSVGHCYLPYDLPFAVNAFLKAVRPDFGILMETEIWPNMIDLCKKQSIPLILVNARLSERSLRGYQRFASLAKSTLNKLAFIAAQSPEDQQRFVTLGADKQRVFATGNLKYEIELPASLKEKADHMRDMWNQNRPVWVAASTHEGEDELILNASRQVRGKFPNLLLIIVPRHPERFDRVTALCQRSGFVTLRRSEQKPCPASVQVLMVDTMGELLLFYAASDVAFVGGSLVEHGGHNILEPAALGRASVTGPHYFNFQAITKQFLEANALLEVKNVEQLASTVTELLQDSTKRAAMGEAGLNIIRQSQGATLRVINLIKRHITHEQ